MKPTPQCATGNDGKTSGRITEEQNEHIRLNFMELISNTTVNLRLLAKLYESGILSGQEIDVLNNISGKEDQAYKLYRLIVTRLHGYTTLAAALQQTSQSVPYLILKEKLPQPIETNNTLSRSSSEPKTRILEIPSGTKIPTILCNLVDIILGVGVILLVVVSYLSKFVCLVLGIVVIVVTNFSCSVTCSYGNKYD